MDLCLPVAGRRKKTVKVTIFNQDLTPALCLPVKSKSKCAQNVIPAQAGIQGPVANALIR